MKYECEISDKPAKPAMCIRTHAAVQDLGRVLGEAYGAIAAYLGENGQMPAGAPYVAYYNADMQNLDLEIGMPCAQVLPARGAVQPSEIPGGKQASTVHVGPYDQIGEAYQALGGFIAEKGLQSTGVAYEIYLSDPSDTAPQDLKTRILFPLQNVPVPA